MKNYPWAIYGLACYRGRCGYIKDEKIEGRVTIFLSGKMISTGAKSIRKSVYQLKRALELLVANNFVNKTILHPRIQNIAATADFKVGLDIRAIATIIPNVIYEPDQFPGAILRTDSSKVTRR